MTVQALPWSIQGQSHSAEIARNHTAAMFGAPVSAFTNAVQATTHGGSHGIVGAGDFAVTQNGTPNMSVNVAAGRALIRSGNASSIAAGVYAVLNDATVNVAIAAADPTNPRIDLVVVQVRDTNYGEATNDVRITVITGTPAASPAVPALTSYPNALVLAQIAVAAADTSIVTGDITDKRTYATALGGTQWCTSTTRPTGVALREGSRIYELDTNRELLYDGTGWVIMSEPAQSYTPSLTNMTLGNGTVAGSYHRSDGWCDFTAAFTLGSTSAVAANAAISIPVAYFDGTEFESLPVFMYDSSVTTRYYGHTYAANPSLIGLVADASAAAHITGAIVSGTVPFTWATGDIIKVSGRYRMTTRYS